MRWARGTGFSSTQHSSKNAPPPSIHTLRFGLHCTLMVRSAGSACLISRGDLPLCTVMQTGTPQMLTCPLTFLILSKCRFWRSGVGPQLLMRAPYLRCTWMESLFLEFLSRCFASLFPHHPDPPKFTYSPSSTALTYPPCKTPLVL